MTLAEVGEHHKPLTELELELSGVKCEFAEAGFIASVVFLSCGAIVRNLMWFNYDEQQESELR